MADIHIEREHALGLVEARTIAIKWAEKIEEKFDMKCTYQEGHAEDTLGFTKPGVQGTLVVTQNSFELTAQLGFLLGVFKDRIEAEIVKNLDSLIAKKSVAPRMPAKKTRPQKKIA